jgi:hypothetical protein
MSMLSKNQIKLIFILSLILCCKLGFAQKKVYAFSEFDMFNKNKNMNAHNLSMGKTSFSIPSHFYVSQLGVMCKKEWMLEKKTGVPFRFRLGSTNYCDWMEGKPNAIKPNY